MHHHDNSELDVPACGLYLTTMPLAEHEDAVPAGRLVMFHNHSEQGPPIVLLPEHNVRNRWHFKKEGFLVEDTDYLQSMEPLKSEGFYHLREHFHPNQEEIVADKQLVQLGYNMEAESIIFFPAEDKDTNALIFPNSGMKIPAQIYDLLEPLTTRGPYTPETPHLH